MNDLIKDLTEIKKVFKNLVESNNQLTQSDFKLLHYILEIVNKMLFEIENNKLTPKVERYAYLGKLITDNYLSPVFKNEIGKKLIRIERQYIELER